MEIIGDAQPLCSATTSVSRDSLSKPRDRIPGGEAGADGALAGVSQSSFFPMARLTVRCGSFADYLVPKLLDDVLRLRSVVCCTVEGIRALERLDDPSGRGGLARKRNV